MIKTEKVTEVVVGLVTVMKEIYEYEMEAVTYELEKAFEEIDGLNHVITEHESEVDGLLDIIEYKEEEINTLINHINNLEKEVLRLARTVSPAERSASPVQAVGLKQCSTKWCGQLKPATEFYKHSRNSDGYQFNCKACNDVQRKSNKKVGK
jgi:uncharacterized protein YoxC